MLVDKYVQYANIYAIAAHLCHLCKSKGGPETLASGVRKDLDRP